MYNAVIIHRAQAVVNTPSRKRAAPKCPQHVHRTPPLGPQTQRRPVGFREGRMDSKPIPKISLERILAERHGDQPLNRRRDYHREYMRKYRERQQAENRSQD